ncbi:MAG: NADH-quinone oxidoreductase subunit N [Candidatus Micrarchaeota archaeon]|nr:NADH-quinone oxidoreductase subunit N [Candidatus Micrarchaeota archaeon]
MMGVLVSSMPVFYIFATLCALLVLFNLVGAVGRRTRMQFASTVLFLALIAGSIAWMIMENPNYVALGALHIDAFSLFFALIFTFGLMLVNILGYARDIHYSNFALLGSFALMGMYLVAFASSLVSIFIGLELMGISTIFAMLLSKRVAIEASVKLFILASVAIALFSFGMVLVYGATGSVALVAPATAGNLILVALGMILAALGFEAALFPFNLWVPDVYQGASTYVTAMIGGINKKVGFLALIEVLFLLFAADRAVFVPIMYALSVITMFYGNFAALAQRNVKRMLAYSSIAQAGYIAIGLAVASSYSLSASLFQIFAHMIMFIGAIAVVLFMESKNRNEINDYIGLHKESSVSAFCFAIMLLSLIGTPLTMGFIGKFLLFSSAVYGGALALALFGVLNSVISVYYYFKVITAMYSNKSNPQRLRVKGNVLLVIVLCTLLVIGLGVYPNLMMGLAGSAAALI